MYRLVIWDMDGTTLYTLKDLKNAVNTALIKHDFPERSEAEIQSFVGNGIHRLVELSVPSGTDEKTTEDVFQYCMEYYSAHCNDHTEPYPGILPLLEKLKDEGIHTAIVSNKADNAVKTLTDIYFHNLIEYSVGEKRTVRRKPAPDSVLKVLKYFHVDKKDAVYIGDSEVDIETAKNAGIDCISVAYGYRDREFLQQCESVTIVDSVEQLQKKLLKKE